VAREREDFDQANTSGSTALDLSLDSVVYYWAGWVSPDNPLESVKIESGERVTPIKMIRPVR
jgi:hypothetical protein